MKSHRIIREKIGDKIIRDVDIANCVYGTDVVRNNIEARCQVIRGELPYNVLLGVPLHQNKEDIDLSVMNIINTTLGVGEVVRFSSRLAERKYSANAIITSNNISLEVAINE